MIQERRQHQRVVPGSPPSVYLGESGSGLLFDLSEGGLAVDGPPAKNRNQVISVAFDLPGGNGHIRARAEIAWTSDSGYRTGLRFLDLAETSQQQLREWISARSDATGLASTKKEAAQPFNVTHAIDDLLSPISQDRREEEIAHLRAALAPVHRTSRPHPNKPAVGGNQELGRISKLRHPVGVFLAVVVLAPFFVFLGHLLANRGHNPQAIETTTIARAAKSHTKGASASVELPLAADPSRPATVPVDIAGFVLQVGAMTHESNADVLRESLEHKNFPAFVFRRGSGRFYKVNVGPYSDAATAARVKNELEVQGIEAILRRWSPE